ncbi:MAG: L-seryl-tRNA(Sec) selenium transferase [Deltaproteobacteria bacterium]|nr:L-seryl-tRNA(Sec) selenium transferase [Deltaproteobacteria bacterium]
MIKDKQALFRKIPGVDRLLNSPDLVQISSKYPRSLILKAINEVLSETRKKIEMADRLEDISELSVERISSTVKGKLELLDLSSLRAVINATGVVVHTNLGRSILAGRVLRKFKPLGGSYSNLEFDLDEGKRGSRYSHVEGILKELTSAEAAMVVNNNAAAVLISLQTMAKGREVVVSRGEMVEIGGSFRIPDVMRKSGAKMVEVGTTNKTHIRDYEEVIGPDTALLLKVHRSNFQIVGFTEDVEPSQLVDVGTKYNIPVMEDLGSGCLVDLSKYGLIKEPTVQEALEHGVDLVTFSGDKLLGGPQAGIILGKKHLVDAIRENQLNRALRIDKLTLLALEETLNIYRDERVALREIPTLKMICQPYRSLKTKVHRLVKLIGRLNPQNFTLELADGSSMVGGGALPLQELPSRLLCLIPEKLSAHYMEEWLRSYDPPIVGRLERDRLLLDVRTIQEKELKRVAHAIKELAEDNPTKDF